jgi:hypothetical protein
MNGPAQLAALTVLAAAVYLGLCALWPLRNCRRCHGTGQRPAPFGGGFRLCPTCNHTGYRQRLGARLIDHARNRKDHP